MRKIIRFAQTIRNNWKKSLFAACLVSYGVNYAKKSYDTKQLMREYCLTAEKYGLAWHPVSQPLRRITVILNPAADRRRAKAQFEKYCAPLLHLAGIEVTIVQTEFAGHAKELPSSISPNTNAIVVAGGDGTLSETVTGLLRRAEGNLRALKNLPIGILPLGRTNSLASSLIGEHEQVRALAEGTMAIIDGSIKNIDVMRIDPIEEESKPVFGVAKIEWGAHRDIRAKRDSYWLFGSWRDYVSYLFNNSPKQLQWQFLYSEPCPGCTSCVVPEKVNRRWWHAFIRQTPTNQRNTLTTNEQCGQIVEKDINTVGLIIATETVQSLKENDIPQLSVAVGPETISKTKLIKQGWENIKNKNYSNNEMSVTPVRQIQLIPRQTGDQWFSIDSEDFEVKPISVSLLPKSLSIFIREKIFH